MTSLREHIEQIHVARELFPRCVRCGEDMSDVRLREMMIASDRPNRFAHQACQSRNTERVDAA